MNLDLKNINLVLTQLRLVNFVPVICSSLIGWLIAPTQPNNTINLYLLTATLILLCAFFTLQNDITDYPADKRSRRSTPLVNGLISIPFIKKMSHACLVVATSLAILLAISINSLIWLILTVIYTALLMLYNSDFVRLKRPILAILILALIMGCLPLLLAYLVTKNTLTLNIGLIIIGIGTYRFSISILKDYKDYKEDLIYKKLTFLIKYGGKKTRISSLITAFVGSFAYLLATYRLEAVNYWLLIMLGLFASLQVTKRLQLGIKQTSYRDNASIFANIYKSSLYFDIGLAVCLYIF